MLSVEGSVVPELKNPTDYQPDSFINVLNSKMAENLNTGLDFSFLTVKDIVTTINRVIPKKLITLQPSTTLEEATVYLSEEKKLSAPVWDEEKKKYLGVIDIFDLMTFIIFGPVFDDTEKQQQYFSYKNSKFRNQTIGEFFTSSYRGIATARRKKILTSNFDDTLQRILHKFANASVYRVLLEESNKHYIIAQTDIVRYLNQHVDKLSPIADQTVEHLNLIAGRTWTVPATASALDGFRQISAHNINAVAVVDDSKKLVENLSAADIRGVLNESMDTMLLPVLDYLRLPQTRPESHPVNDVDGPITCHPTSTLRDVMNQAVEKKVHRVWIVNYQSVPIGVVTLSDIIRLFSPEDSDFSLSESGEFE